MLQIDPFERLKRAMDTISENPKTLTEVSFLFEEFVASIEEIAHDLAIDSDEFVAENLREVAAILQEADTPSLGCVETT
jgi:hypothetical protein